MISSSADRPVNDSAAVAEPPLSAACLNCRTPLGGPFCSACGQRDIPPYPTVRELTVDAFWELSGWDGRFARTIRTLVRGPGRLTREYLEGRRARYVSPLRLYLMASLVYFVLAAAAPELERPSRGDDVSVGAGINVRIDTGSTDRQAALDGIQRAPSMMRPFLRRALEDPAGLQQRILETLPRIFFALLPVFAAIVAIFYRGRKYPEHLYFAVHLHAFVFLALAVPELLSFTRSSVLADAAAVAAMLWILVYTTRAFLHVYGGRLTATLVKEAGIGVIYSLVSLPAFILAMYWAAISD